MIVTCPKYESDGKTLSPLAGQAVIANLMPGRWGVIATPGADRIARGEEWLQTNTLDGQKAHDVFTRIGEPSYFQEFGPASYHVSIGFANPAIINARQPYVCNGTDPNSPQPARVHCNNTITGKVTGERLSRTPDERLYSSGSHDTFYWTQCYVSFGDPDGEDFAFTKCNGDGTFHAHRSSRWRLESHRLRPVERSAGGWPFDTGGESLAADRTDQYGRHRVHPVADEPLHPDLHRRQQGRHLAGRRSGNSIRERRRPVARRQPGKPLVTDFTGTANFNETFPLFSWYTVETDVTRYKNTGTHVVYDVGGPADGSASCGTTGYPPCGTSTIGKIPGQHRGNRFRAHQPARTGLGLLRRSGLHGQIDSEWPGTSDPPSVCTTSTATRRSPPARPSSPRAASIHPWTGGVEGWQGFPGQNNFLEFGKEPYVAGENGGIKGHVIYASTRPFDDPQMLVQTQWEPLVPHVTINLYQEGVASDGVTPTLTLVDTTQTSSWDDYAQGFRADGVTPNMNCPGQGAIPAQSGPVLLLAVQPAELPGLLQLRSTAGPRLTPLPNNSQFKCYDGMHNWNQLQPAPYDGMYQFPSVTPHGCEREADAGTNCTICTPNPVRADAICTTASRMLPAGKYVVEVVCRPGYELVKEEDKNILIGDNFIAPVTQEFGGLGNIFILPDQASVAAATPAPVTTPTTRRIPPRAWGPRPSNNIVPGFIPEPTWPCVGEARIVPDYISLYPQSQQVAPFAGATRNLCDRKEVTLDDQMGAIAKFYVYTSTHIASKFTGGITDDLHFGIRSLLSAVRREVCSAKPTSLGQGLGWKRNLARVCGPLGRLRRHDLLDVGSEPAEPDRLFAHDDGLLHERPRTDPRPRRNADYGPCVYGWLQPVLL